MICFMFTGNNVETNKCAEVQCSVHLLFQPSQYKCADSSQQLRMLLLLTLLAQLLLAGGPLLCLTLQ